MIPEIVSFYEILDRTLRKDGFCIGASKDVPYGLQLIVEDAYGASIPLTIYFSKKKGLSAVLGGSPKNPLKGIIQTIVNDLLYGSKTTSKPTTKSNIKWKTWVGTDESGKGDFFGPLVVCGFISSPELDSYLTKLGIIDSKKLTDKRIAYLANILMEKLPKNYRLMKLNPVKYNELYAKFVEQNKKLNQMMAWMHSRIILDLKKQGFIEGAIVDKFANERTIFSSLQGMKDIPMIIETKAESYPAVAAASILARNAFVNELKSMEKKFGMPFHKGANPIVIKQGKAFVQKFGKEKLHLVAKTHFATIKKI